MPANNDYPIIDGIAPSWADVSFKTRAIGGAPLESKDVKSVNIGCTIEIGNQVAGGRVKKRTTGSSKYDASATVYRNAWNEWLRANDALMFTRGNQRIYGLLHFDVQLLHTPPGSAEIYDIRLKGCRVTGRTFNGAEGNDADVIELALNPIEIVDVIDGKEYVIL